MKGSITKIFKLDEPLGRRGFGLISFNILVLTILINFFERMYFNKSTLWYTTIIIAIITPFAVRRLKDIDANKFLAGLFMLPMLYLLFFYSTMIIPFLKTNVFNPLAGSIAMFMIFFPLIIVILFLCLLLIKGSKDNVRKYRFIRKNTLIINATILSYILIVWGCQHFCVNLKHLQYSPSVFPQKISEAVDRFLTIPEFLMSTFWRHFEPQETVIL